MDFNNDDDSSMWDWQCQEYDLGDDATLDISKSFLHECPVDDLTCVLDAETTPVKVCGDMAYHFNSSENNKDLGQCEEVALQVKRRRMLHFESEELGASLCIEDFPSSFLRANEPHDSLEEGISEMSQWVSGFADGTSTSGVDVLDQSYDEWLSDCLNDTEMHLCSEDINSSGGPDVHMNVADLCDTPPENENNIVQAPPVHTRGNVSFKGRKSFMRTPAKLPSSVVYPFAFIKPCSVQGEVTLKDINQRIHNPASKLKQKKKDPLAAFPTSAISGKPVVGKTKIHTVGGKGSITIMRTKG